MKKVLILVADSLNYEDIKDIKADIVKPLTPNAPYTAAATFSILYGRPVSHIFWPDGGPDLLKEAFPSQYRKEGALELIPKLARKISEISIVESLKRNGVKTIVLNYMGSPPVSQPNSFNYRFGPDEYGNKKVSTNINSFLFQLYNKMLEAMLGKYKYHTDLIAGNWVVTRPIAKAVLSSKLYSFHADTIKDGLIRSLKELDGNVFVYAHILSPHLPYECGFKDTMYSLFHFIYSTTVYTSSKLTPRTISELKEFYETDFREFFLGDEIIRRVKKAYLHCVGQVKEMFYELSEELSEWTLILTSDHPEYFWDSGYEGFLSHPEHLPLNPKKVPMIVSNPIDDMDDIKSQIGISKYVLRTFGIDKVKVYDYDHTESICYKRVRKRECNFWAISTGNGVYYYGSDDDGNLKEFVVGNVDMDYIERVKEETKKEREKIWSRIRLKIRVGRRLHRHAR